MTRHDDLLYFGHMLDAAREAAALVVDVDEAVFYGNRLLQLGLTKLVEIVGEAARHVSPSGKTSMPTVPWPKIVGMRHRLVHDYTDLKLDILWGVVTVDLPPLIAALETVVPPEPPDAPAKPAAGQR